MLVGIEEIDRLARPARRWLVAWPLHVADRVEPVAIRNAGRADPGKGRVELGLGECKGQMLAAAVPQGAS